MIIDKKGYLSRARRGSRSSSSTPSVQSNIFFPKFNSATLKIRLQSITLPEKYAGKRIRLKITIEEVENE